MPRLQRPSKEQSPDQLYQQVIIWQRKLAKHCNQSVHELRMAKRAAWQAAFHYHQLYQQHHDYILQMAISKVGEGPDVIDRWIRETFAPLRRIGEDPFLLIHLVSQGTSLAEYLADEPALISERRRRNRLGPKVDADGLPAVPADPPDSMSLAETVTQLRAQNAAYKELCAELKRRLAVMEKVTDKITAQVHRLKIA
jgi:hypothetical protein